MEKGIIKLKFGDIYYWEEGAQTLYVYDTKDPIGDQVILVRNEKSLVSIESPLFKNNVVELNAFVEGLCLDNTAILLSDHVAPKDYLPGGKLLTTQYALDNLRSGSAKGLFDGFVKSFCDAIQNDLRDDFSTVGNDFSFNGIKLVLLEKDDEFDVSIPSFNAVYTHMVGHDVHSIIGGDAGADLMIKTYSSFYEAGYGIILSSHYIPETRNDLLTKIAYIERIKKISSESKDRAEFVEKAKKDYPNYSGLNYLEITSSIYFAK